MTALLDAARYYLALGYHPIPCGPRSKRPLVKWEPYQHTAPLPEEIETWWSQWPEANVALVLGRGTFAVDLDGGADAQRLLFERGVLLPGAPRSKTAHGAHVFLAGSVPDRVGLLSTNGKKPQVDIRGVGYVVAPPSVHPDGPVYEWVVPLTATLPAAPPELLALIHGTVPTGESVGIGGTGWVAELLAGVPEGQRDHACTRLTGYFLGKGLPEETVETILLHTFAVACTPPADPDMIRKCVRSIGKKEHRVVEPDRAIAAQTLAQALEDWHADRGKPTAVVRTPFYRLNTFLGGGFSPGELIYIGARPGVGKTALALELARATGADGRAVLVVSREMVNVAVARRMVTQESGIATTLLKRNEPLELEDTVALTAALHKLRPLPIWLSDEAVSIDEIRVLTAALRERVPLALVLVDYLQLVRAPKEIRDRRLQVEAVSQGLKALAVEHKLPVVCLSSLARPEKGAVRRPTLSDLRESGELEHDADVVLLLHRAMLETEAECIVAKNREGSPGIVRLHFDGPSLHFRESVEQST